MSNAEELAKYKELLDDRVITQEDFDKKKEELLNRNESSGLTTDNTWLVALLLCLFVGFLGILFTLVLLYFVNRDYFASPLNRDRRK